MNGLATELFVSTDCPLPLDTVTIVGARAAIVCVKVTGANVPAVAVIVAAPAVIPAVYVVDAIPKASVIAVTLPSAPPPVTIANVTVVPATGVPA